jgi:hypothetical protein
MAAPTNDEWLPIATLQKRDDVVLWNPCDGLNLLSYCATDSDIERMRKGKIYTHWRVVTAPNVAVGADVRRLYLAGS